MSKNMGEWIHFKVYVHLLYDFLRALPLIRNDHLQFWDQSDPLEAQEVGGKQISINITASTSNCN